MGMSTAAAGVGAGLVGVSWWNRKADDSFLFLDKAEAQFVRALSGAAWPATRSIPFSGEQLNLDHFFDESLTSLEEEPRTLIRFLLHTLESSTLPTRMGFFSGLELQERQDVLQGWLAHLLPEIRQAAQSLCILTGTGFTTHPDVSPFFQAMHGCVYGR